MHNLAGKSDGTASRSAMVGCLIWLIAAFASAAHAEPSKLPHVEPEAAGMDGGRLDAIDGLVKDALDEGRMPGCVVTIGRRGGVVFQKAYGYRQVRPEKEPMTVDTVFDLASLTKPIATATSIMVLVERGEVRIRSKVAKYLPEFANHGKEDIRVKQLLTHRSGLKPIVAIERTADSPDAGWQQMFESELRAEPDTAFIYSDVNFMLLGKIVERVSGQSLHEFSREHIYRPLGMNETGFLPSEELRRRCACTEERDGKPMRGDVHDPRAWFLGGIAGHAGLFSTADDLALYAQMMLGGGAYPGDRVLSRPTIELMTAAYDIGRGTRGLGWDKRSPYSSNRGELMSERAFGHGGFTGTAIWIDPELDLFVIFLSNRVHPDGKGNVNDLIGRIGNVAVGAITSQAPSPSTNDNLSPSPQAGEGRGGGDRAPEEHASSAARHPHPQPLPHRGGGEHRTRDVLNGIDVLERDGFKQLAGRRVGIITNHTGHSRDRVSTVELLHEAADVELVAIFSPEHGFRGVLDQANISHTKDEATGLPIYSLYGETRKPTAEMLQDIDTLVFDIQDIGTRFYTYISTMGLAMEAAAENGLRFVVLDRVNPIGGHIVAGPVLDVGAESFVGFHPIAVRHGMTIGELARMFRSERGLESLDLVVVPLAGWRRDMYFDETGLPWTNPSPNMRSLTQAVLYPGIGLLETTNLSVGRGTDTPFEVIGAPWIDGRDLARALTSQELPGATIVPIEFEPTASKFAGETCGGINVIVTDRRRFEPVRSGLAVARQLRLLYPKAWKMNNYIRLLGNESVYNEIARGASLEEAIDAYQDALADFQHRRRQYLLY